MRLDMPKSLILSQLPQLYQDATMFPLSIRVDVFEASQDGEQDPTETCHSHSQLILPSTARFVPATGSS